MEFVGADRDKVGVELMNVCKRLFAKPLDGVGVEDCALLTAKCTQLTHWLDRTDLVVGGHDRDEDGVRAQCLLQCCHTDSAFAVHREPCDLKTFFFRQILEALKCGMVLNCGRNEVPAPVLEQACGAQDRQIIALGAAAGKDDFARSAAEDFRHPVASVIEQSAGLTPDMV